MVFAHIPRNRFLITLFSKYYFTGKLGWGSHHPPPPPKFGFSSLSCYVSYGIAPTSRTKKNKTNLIYEQALRLLKNTPDVSDEDKSYIAKLVEHLLAKGGSKQCPCFLISKCASAKLASNPFGYQLMLISS